MFLPDKAEFIFALPPTGESQDEDEEEGGEAGAHKNKNQKKNNKGVQRLSQADLKELAKGEKDIVQDLEFSDDE